MSDTSFERLRGALADRTAVVGVIGLGYVGLPLAASAGRAGFPTVGFDIDPAKAEQLNAGRSYIDAVSNEDLNALVSAERFTATADFDRLAECGIDMTQVTDELRDEGVSAFVSAFEGLLADVASKREPVASA